MKKTSMDVKSLIIHVMYKLKRKMLLQKLKSIRDFSKLQKALTCFKCF